MSAIGTAKEILHQIVFMLTAGTRIRPSRWRTDDSYMNDSKVRSRFEAIYERGIWQLGRDDLPTSGDGSTLNATARLRASLPSLLDRIDAKILLDVGCGDFTWMRETFLSQNYVGIDIVRSVIEKNQSFASATRAFICLDALEDDLPDADTVLCREVLFHLSLADGKRALANILRRRRQWLIVTTDTDTMFNADIRTGDYRRLNLRCAPFRFPNPDYVLDDSTVTVGRQIGVWRAGRIDPHLASRW
jgi:SAM-dependent methyltransferase